MIKAGLTKEQEKVKQILITHVIKGECVVYTDLVKEAKLDLDMSNPFKRQ